MVWLAAIALVSYDVEARLDPQAQVIEGRLSVEIENPTRAPLEKAYLWLYPNSLAKPPESLDDVNRYWIYPRGFNPGRIDVTKGGPAYLDHEKGGERSLAVIGLEPPVPPGEKTLLELEFRTQIPDRYGVFGCAAEVCTLAAGWHPKVAFLDDGGWDLQARPARADYEVRVRSPWTILLAGKVRDQATLKQVWQVPVIAYQRFFVERRDCGGYRVSYASRFTPVPPSDGRFPYVLENFYKLGLDNVCDALEMLPELDLRPPQGAELMVAEVPLRYDLASQQGEVVLISDRAWRIFPVARFRKFHTLQVARALYGYVFEKRLAAQEHPRDLAWVPDAVATYMVDLYTMRQYRRKEFARDVLKYFSFVPAIDSLIYAPKVRFTSAYFGGVEDAEPVRDDSRRWNNDLPKGKRVYEKLRDLLQEKTIGLMRVVIVDGEPMRKAAEKVAGRDLDWFFEQWLGPYPPNDVSLAEVDSEKKGAGYRHRIRVVKRGHLVEPVELWVRDDNGETRREVWDGNGREHIYELESSAPLDVVHIDPRQRLVERRDDIPDDPRFDNRAPPRYKLIYNNFGALFNVTELSASVSANFTLRRIYDLRNAIGFGIFHTPVTDYGVSARYTRNFGHQADSNRLVGGAGGSVSVARLNDTFAIDSGTGVDPGTRISLRTSIGYDDRIWFILPERGNAISASVGTAFTILDDGPALQTYSTGLGATKLLRFGAGHVLAFNASTSAVFGDIRLFSQLLGGGLLGYEPGEILGRGSVRAVMEYRHIFVHGLDWNIMHIARGRAIGGAVVLGGATMASCEEWPEGLFDRNSFFFDAGYSLRGYFDHLGVSQAVLRADIGFPLNRHARDCLGFTFSPEGRKPFGLIVSFAPTF